MSLSARAKNISPSPTLAITAKAKQMKAQGIDVISFGAGEPDFDTPDHIKAAAIRAIQEGFTKYTPSGGIDELKDAVVKKLKRDNHLEYEKSEVVISCGAKHSLFNLAEVLFEEGDEVIIPAPYWVTYPEQVKLAGAKPVFVQTPESEGFALSRPLLEAAITPRTKAVILNSPGNPTGAVYNRQLLQGIADLAGRSGIYVISDECYEALTYDGEEHVSIASLGKEIRALTVVVNACSKPYSMTGWRIGYAAGPREIIKAMDDLQSQSTSNPTSIAQKAAVEALLGPQDAVAKMRSEFDRRRRTMVDRLNAMPGVTCTLPKGAFYAFPNFSPYYGRKWERGEIHGSSDLATYLLEDAQVAVVPGLDFGSDSHIRLSYATSMANIEKGLERIANSLAKLA
ncbi:MAG: pyridoxal phosphate-dependent aminotransferase [candidate division NC10 bacterium]|nr:pyridoxal phosphate-dependent aminotransferase [candidate division NC10 bacterium]